jgi:DNA-binding HxlR family transcriptional regulator
LHVVADGKHIRHGYICILLPASKHKAYKLVKNLLVLASASAVALGDYRRAGKLSCETFGRKGFGGSIREDYLDLVKSPTVLFHPYRLIIMQTLSYHGNVEYREMRHSIPDITDGNLASHLRALEGCRYIRYHKEIVGRKPRTSYEITEEGRKAFEEVKGSLRKLVIE